MRGPQVRSLLAKTKELMGERPWGVGILGFMPLDLRTGADGGHPRRQAALRDYRGRQAKPGARNSKRSGISTYLHVPSPGLLQGFHQGRRAEIHFRGQANAAGTPDRARASSCGSRRSRLLINAED